MSKAEEYIALASDEIGQLCDTKALKAVEIAKEEMIEKACKWLNKNTGFFNDKEFIKAMKNE